MKTSFIPDVIFKKYLWWVTEGVAQVLANQSLNKELLLSNIDSFIKNSLYQNIDYPDFVKKQGYQISKQLMFKIQKENGNKVLHDLLTVKPDELAKEKISHFLNISEQDIDLKIKEVLLK